MMYVGLDVSQKSTAICVVNERGERQWRGTCASDPQVLATQLNRHAGADARIGIETGAMTPWLVHGLRQAGLAVDCLDARRVKAALQMRLNKTDQNDAEGLAQVMRTGWYRPVHVKSLDAHRARSLLGARAQLVGMRTRLTNMIRGILKTYGMLPGSGRGLRFDRRVEELIQDDEEVGMIVRPLLATLRHLGEQITTFDKGVQRQVRADPTCRLLMSVPGIGALSSLVYVSTVEDPKRFSRSRAVGAHLGLTPRRYQSGDIDRTGRISRCGDSLARTLMYEAAIVILHRVKRASQLSEWAQAIAQRAGPGKARVALARKLSVILHSIWRSGEAFRWSVAPMPS
jgi:transposase